MDLKILNNKPFTLVTGIANPKTLVSYLKSLNLEFEHLNFKDHHDFSAMEIDRLKQKSLIVTTEKDMMRLQPYFNKEEAIYCLPIEIKIDRPIQFNALVRNFVKS